MIIDVVAQKSLLSRHVVHLLSIGIPVGLVALGLAVDSVRNSRRRGRADVSLRRAPSFVAAGACVGAAAVHVWVAPEHFHESLIYGSFFVVLALAQLAGAWLVAVGRSRVVVVAVALGSATVIGLWLVTRVIAIPLGPDAGATEPFGVLDIAASVFEAVVVASCGLALRHGSPAAVHAVPAPASRRQVLAQ